MGIIAFIILGLIVGIIARAIVPGTEPGGLIVSAVLGMIGALGAGWIASAMFDVDPMDGFFDLSTWVAAILGAVVVVAIYGALTQRGSNRGHLNS